MRDWLKDEECNLLLCSLMVEQDIGDIKEHPEKKQKCRIIKDSAIWVEIILTLLSRRSTILNNLVLTYRSNVI